MKTLKDGDVATVLITAAGGAGTIEIIRSLHELGCYRIIGVDASKYADGFTLTDKSFVVPMADAENFIAVVRNILKKEQPDFVIPLVDEEILAFYRIVEELDESKTRIIAPVEDFCVMALDKWLTFLKLENAAIPTAHTCLASDADNCTYPAVIKPRDGRGSRELAYLTGPDDLAVYLRQASRSPDRYVVQERIFGSEYTVSVVVGLDGTVLAVVPKQVIVKRGITQVGVTRIAPDIEQLCEQIQSRLRADGPFNVQLIMTEQGKAYVIEINPRYSTTVALTIAAGVNEVDVVIRHALGRPLVPCKFQPNLLMLRHYTQRYVPETEWPPKQVICMGADTARASESAEEIV